MRELKPWHENINKRQVKSSKIYFRDGGIYHALLGLESHSELLRNPKIGASWEGFALEQIIAYHQVRSEECYFWGVHSQCELDLMIHDRGKRYGYEIKFSDAPKLTSSMQQACDALALDSFTVIYPREKGYALTEKITVRSILDFSGAKS